MTLVFGGGRLVSEATPESPDGEMAMTEQPVIECHGLSKLFDAAYAVRDVSLALEPGEILALVGPSGSGKTTFLRLVAGFEVPDTGTVTIEGQQVAGTGRWVPPEARRLAMVFQDYALFPHMTVVQNVVFGLKGWSRRSRARRARQILEMVRMDHMADRSPYQLSGGEQQRVALARSLAPRPLALLLDEPFSNLDPQLRVQLRAEVKNILRSSKVTAVYVTHDQEEALFMGDRVAVMNGGSVEQMGAPEDIFHHPRSRFVARFLGIADFIPAQVTKAGLVTEMGVLHSSVRLPPGTEVEVMVRPDDVAILPSDAGVGRVISRVFRGMHYLYNISLPSGAMVHCLKHHTSYYQQGASVDVYLEPNQTLTCFVDSVSELDPETGASFSAVTGERPQHI